MDSTASPVQSHRPVRNEPIPGAIATAAAYLLVLTSPAVAWLVCLSWADGKGSDQMNVLWFVLVAIACAGAGSLAGPRWLHWISLAVLGVSTALPTLYFSWSAQDDSGLFVIGVVLSIPLFLGGAPALVALGASLAHLRRRAGRCA